MFDSQRTMFTEGDPVRVRADGRTGTIRSVMMQNGSGYVVQFNRDEADLFALDELERPVHS